MEKLKKIVNLTEKAIEIFNMIILVSIVIAVSLNVATRLFIKYSFAWSEELPLIFLNWFVVLGLAIAVGRKNHVAIEYFYSNSKLKNKILLSYIVYLVSAIFGGVLLYFGVTNIIENLNVTLPATGLSQSVRYIFFPLSGILIIFYSIIDIIELKITGEPLKTMLEDEIKEIEVNLK